METASRRSQIGVDADRLSFELLRRGITADALAARAGIAQSSLSRIRHGRGVSPGVMRRIAAALISYPILPGADLLIARPDDDRGDAA